MIGHGKAKVPTPTELKRLFAITRTSHHCHRNIALLVFSYRLGLRAKEIASLKIKHVINEQGEVLEECNLNGFMTKGGKARTVYLTNSLVRQSLKEYVDTRRIQEGIIFNEETALFKSQKGSNFSANTMQQLLKRLHLQAGILGGRSHSGRRWFATELISKGTDIKAVSVLMGHSSIAMTAHYVEDNPQVLRKIAAGLQ